MRFLLPSLAFGLLAGCNLGAFGNSATLGLELAATSLPGIDDIAYDVSVYGADGQLLWTETLSSATYGTTGGRMSYVGGCDSGSGTATNTVEVGIASIVPLSPEDYIVPQGVISRQFQCTENTDTAVGIEFTILLTEGAGGFLDLSIDTNAVVCSAKLDCEDPTTGLPAKLAVDPITGERLDTTVMALTCSAGDGTDNYLYVDEAYLDCSGIQQSFPLDIGNNLGSSPIARSITTFTEGTSGFSTWATQIGWEDGFWDSLPADCSLHALATVTDGPLANGTLAPAGPYPLIEWDVDLTDASGERVCDQHPLGSGTGVDPVFASEGETVTFTYSYPDGPVDEPECTDDLDCEDGDVCDPTGTCVPGAPPTGECQADTDCGAGQVCEGDVCVTTGAYRVTLTWETATDCDLHIIRPDGFEISYVNRVAPDGNGNLDVDNQSGGPGSVENIYFTSRFPEPLQAYVVNYNGQDVCEYTLAGYADGTVQFFEAQGGIAPEAGAQSPFYDIILP